MKELKQGLVNAACILGLIAVFGFVTLPNGTSIELKSTVDGYEDYKTFTATVNATESLATILGEALPASVVGITILNPTTAVTLNYQCDGSAADATDAAIPPGAGITAAGNKTKLDKIRLYTGGANDMCFIVHTLE